VSVRDSRMSKSRSESGPSNSPRTRARRMVHFGGLVLRGFARRCFEFPKPRGPKSLRVVDLEGE
jgi:hypothetical protein